MKNDHEKRYFLTGTKGHTLLACSLSAAMLSLASTAMAEPIIGGGNYPVSQVVNNEQTITGQVVDETGEPMIGVSVLVKGTRNGSATDIDGRYSVRAPKGSTLTFSYVGYTPVNKTVGSSGTIDVRMEPDNAVLDEVVVIGYGSVKKRDLTGAVSSVKAETITLTPTPNPMDALQGRVAGLDISRSSGAPGASVDIQLRGNRSFSASGTPLFIIDGMPGNYETLNPNDIESIEVLKDASSTAIYGSAGANGVIIITTKKGQTGSVRINFDAYYGYNGWAILPEMNTAQQFADTKIAALKYAGLATDQDAGINAALQAAKEGRTINWPDEVLKNGSAQNYSLSVSGGTEKTQVYFSLNYNKVKGQYVGSNYEVYSSSLRANQKIANWIEAGVHTQLSYSDQNKASMNMEEALLYAPFGDLYNEDGSIKVYPFEAYDTDRPSLLLNTQPGVYKNNTKYLRAYVQPYLRIYPIKGMTFETRLSGNFIFRRHNTWEGFGSYKFFQTGNAGAGAVGNETDEAFRKFVTAEIENYDNIGYQWENILTYNFKVANDHDFTLTGVTTWQSNSVNTSTSSNKGFDTNTYYWTNLGQPGVDGSRTSVDSDYTMGKSMGLVARLNYSYLGRYLFSASVRHDGNSVLAKGHRWDTFPAVSAGWRFSDEKFMEWSRNWLNNGKIRVGYGVTGAAGIDAYSSYSILGSNMSALGNQTFMQYYYPDLLSNATLGWEKSKSWNFGLDLSAFNYRIDATLDYYITDTDDVIWKQTLPITNGGGVSGNPYTMNTNIAKTRNHGIELTLNTQNIVTRDFTWSSTLTLTRNWEKVKSLGAGAEDYVTNGDYTLHVGTPVKSFYGYKLDGIWQKGQEADAAVFNRQPGDLRVKVPNMRKVSDGVWEKTFPDELDENGKPITRIFNAENPYTVNTTDRQIIGHNNPDWTIGFNNTFTYKWFDLSIYMLYRGGQMINYKMMNQYNSSGGAFPSYFNYWTPDNPSNDFPSLNAQRNWKETTGWDSMAYQDGSFFKIKNITLGYTLPSAACKKLRIDKLRLYGTITNPVVHATNPLIKGYDPEMNGRYNDPLTRHLVFGINLSL